MLDLGKLGIDVEKFNFKNNEEFYVSFPTPLTFSKTTVRQISCGCTHSALVTTKGELWVWGSNDGGKLGNLFNI